MPDESESFATRALAELPELRRQVSATPEFRAWLEGHRSVVVDGAQFRVVGGDMLKDEDEMILTWAREHDLVDAKILASLQAREPAERTP